MSNHQLQQMEEPILKINQQVKKNKYNSHLPAKLTAYTADHKELYLRTPHLDVQNTLASHQAKEPDPTLSF